jgi:acetylornithine deacetylase/succinyl-diaminopimelate desuccinylase-like protein
MDRRIIEPFVKQFFQNEILPSLMNFVRIPNVSPEYDINWDKNGYQIQAAQYLQEWVKNQNLIGCEAILIKDTGRTPFLYIDIASTKEGDDRTFLMYGHMDKQPPLDGWSSGLGPYKPVLKDGHLYGRGSSDDGYAVFAAVSAVKACQDNNWPLPRVIIIIEACEESNTIDLKYYVEKLSKLIGKPSLIVCLDSGCMDYERLWTTTSLRGVFNFNLKVSLLKFGYHNGNGGGFVADSFLVLRMLLDRIEDSKTGRLKDNFFYPVVPDNRMAEINVLANNLGSAGILNGIQFYKDTKSMSNDAVELILNNTWRPALTILGANGFPQLDKAGNVLRQYSEVKVSMRLPPLIPAAEVFYRIKSKLLENPPYNAKVEINSNDDPNDGWNQHQLSRHVDFILNEASNKFFNTDRELFGEGGSVPFVQYFSERFPKAEITCLGLTGPGSNIHSVDENLNLDYCKKLICCLTYLISDY